MVKGVIVGGGYVLIAAGTEGATGMMIAVKEKDIVIQIVGHLGAFPVMVTITAELCFICIMCKVVVTPFYT